MAVYNRLLSALFLIILTGCFAGPGKKEGRSKGDASFFIHAIDGSAETKTHDQWGLASEKLFNFKVCLRDNAKQEKVSGQSFIVQSDEKEKKLRTDSDGCLNWNETIAYNSLAYSTYISLEREIKGTGLHRGTQIANIAINPWKDGSAAVVDLDEEDVANKTDLDQKENYLHGLYLDHVEAEEKPSVWLNQVHVSAQELRQTKKGVVVELILTGEPLLRTFNDEREPITRPFERGQFSITPYILGLNTDDGKKSRRLLADKVEPVIVDLQQRQFQLRTQILVHTTPTRGQFELGLIVKPENAPAGLQSFEGIFLIGDYNSLEGSHTAINKRNELNEPLIDYLQKVPNEPAQQNLDGFLPAHYRIDVGADTRFLGNDAKETSTWQIDNFTVKACFTHPLNSRKKMNNRKFRIYGTVPEGPEFEKFSKKRNVIEVETDDRGCVGWEDSIRHKYFDLQHTKCKDIIVEDILSGNKQTLTLALNPWDGGWTFGFDVRLRSNETCEKPKSLDPPRLILKSYKFNAVDVEYKVDDMLNIKVIKHYNMMLYPTVALHSLRSGRTANAKQSLHRGYYLLRLIMQRPKDDELDPGGYLDSFEKVVYVDKGIMSANIQFEFDDMEYMATRNQIVIELYPIIESKLRFQGNKILTEPSEDLIYKEAGLELTSFRGPFYPFWSRGSIVLPDNDPTPSKNALTTAANYEGIDPNVLKSDRKNRVEKIDTAKIIREGEALRKQNLSKLMRESHAAGFAKMNRLALYDFTEAKDHQAIESFGLNSTVIENIMRDGLKGDSATIKEAKAFLKKLCSSFQVDALRSGIDGFDSRCQEKPLDYFTLDRKIHVHEVLKDKEDQFFIGGRTENFRVSSNFYMDVGDGRTSSRKTEGVVGYAADLSTGVSVFGGFSNLLGGVVKKALGFLKLDIGGSARAGNNAYVQEGEDESEKAGSRLSVTESAFLLIQRAAFNLTFTKYKQCLAVVLDRKIKRALWHSDPEALSGVYLCLPMDERPMNKRETYFMTYQHFNKAPFLDPQGIRNLEWITLMRGFRDYFTFLRLTEASRTFSELDHGDSEPVKILDEIYDEVLDKHRSYPGVYTVMDGVPKALTEFETPIADKETIKLIDKYLRPADKALDDFIKNKGWDIKDPRSEIEE